MGVLTGVMPPQSGAPCSDSLNRLNGRAYGSDPDVFFLREENCKLTLQQKQTLARVNALFSGILLTSDMPSRYTDEMRRQYNALRELTDHAENCTVDADDGLTVHYTLHGKQQAIKVFDRSAFFKNTQNFCCGG